MLKLNLHQDENYQLHEAAVCKKKTAPQHQAQYLLQVELIAPATLAKWRRTGVISCRESLL